MDSKKRQAAGRAAWLVDPLDHLSGKLKAVFTKLTQSQPKNTQVTPAICTRVPRIGCSRPQWQPSCENRRNLAADNVGKDVLRNAGTERRAQPECADFGL